MDITALVAAAALAVIALFQLGLALGAPWGSAAWGGKHEGTLPVGLRIASGAAGAVVYPLLILVVLPAARSSQPRRRRPPAGPRDPMGVCAT